MSPIVKFGIVFAIAYLAQCLFAFKQIKAFNTAFQAFHKRGKVVTGRKSGRINAGTVILFLVDNNGVILDGTMMQGFSVFAKFKPLTKFNGQHLMSLNKEHELVKKEYHMTRKAIENARELFIRHKTGAMQDESMSPVSPF
ncbi:MAG: transcriptional regulator GutM [Streptococcaceae bacterium]|jgi:DNA-binding transcriptional regulator of glucitol operon|nr:transcriptional regulator GutM [Streptococcaceae bacterium]